MPTAAQAFREVMEKADRPLTSAEIQQAVEKAYPGQWKPATLSASLYAFSVNQPNAYIHHPYTPKFLYKNPDGTFELYEEGKHGPNIWDPHKEENAPEESIERVEASISLERDLETHLVQNLEVLERGLKFVDQQYSTEVGRVDIVAQDSTGTPVLIEIKVGEAKDAVIGQIARYMGWFGREENQAPRGIVVASDFPESVQYGAEMIDGLRLFSYRVSFSFQEETV